MQNDLTWMRARPFAHRGLHDSNDAVCENSLSACQLAIEHDYNIEVDLHPASDGTPMVFHDLTLERMCKDPRHIRKLTPMELGQTRLGKTEDHIPTLEELLALTSGKVGLLLELKGLLGEDSGFVEKVAKILKTYQGNVAIMSFNHWLLKDARSVSPHLALGLTAEGNDKLYGVHQQIADECAVDFVSYGLADMPCRFTSQFAKSSKPVITWTIKSKADYDRAIKMGTIPTFEGFVP